MTVWDIYRCSCGRRFALEQPVGDEIEEPACPCCGGTYCAHEKQLDQLGGPVLPPLKQHDDLLAGSLRSFGFAVIGD
ncbi:hypothetical protein M3223_08710 [Paenibacillus pasadenensis]|uniref:hypothetical protein n=1 Tax=Paenibacillus pasadenensis TaxID=217090 RepID=UPI00203DC4B0|nr:hypothetical protein [Paenibacillus pasadenensis]MCM3747434.1 hypothetical protein [Paenibacillus pasadenensis]